MTITALRQRRPQTLAALLDAHGREIQAVAFLILRDRAAAEDITIETLLTAFEKGGAIRDESAVRAWLLKVATNKALAHRGRGARVVGLDALPDRAAPGDLASEAASHLALLAGVADLPPAMRAAVALRYYTPDYQPAGAGGGLSLPGEFGSVETRTYSHAAPSVQVLYDGGEDAAWIAVGAFVKADASPAP